MSLESRAGLATCEPTEHTARRRTRATRAGACDFRPLIQLAPRSLGLICAAGSARDWNAVFHFRVELAPIESPESPVAAIRPRRSAVAANGQFVAATVTHFRCRPFAPFARRLPLVGLHRSSPGPLHTWPGELRSGIFGSSAGDEPVEAAPIHALLGMASLSGLSAQACCAPPKQIGGHHLPATTGLADDLLIRSSSVSAATMMRSGARAASAHLECQPGIALIELITGGCAGTSGRAALR